MQLVLKMILRVLFRTVRTSIKARLSIPEFRIPVCCFVFHNSTLIIFLVKFAVGWLIFASLAGFLAHFLITDVSLLYFLGKVNPIEYLRHIVPAQMTALACASSAATLPVTLRCVKATGIVPDDIRNFVCPLGATVNMDGSAIYFPCACVWLAYLNGIDPNASVSVDFDCFGMPACCTFLTFLSF